MFAIGIFYLSQLSVASTGKAEEPEWPPHPDRLFMSLVAAYFVDDENPEKCDPSELAALYWLEQQPPPGLCYSDGYMRGSLKYGRRYGQGEVDERETVTVFVPVNDSAEPVEIKSKNKETGLRPVTVFSTTESMPLARNRKARNFPTFVPEDDKMYFLWPTVDVPTKHRPALERLCAKVGYLGDTSSLVQVWVEDNPPPATLIPTDSSYSTQRLRVFYPGRLAVLQKVYERDNRAGQYLPRDETFKWGYYREPEEEQPPMRSSHFSDFIILRRVDGPALDITDTQTLVDTLRGTVMSLWSDERPLPLPGPIPEWVSGHTPDKERSQREHGHLAFIALPNVGYEQSDGELKGLALALPKDAPKAEVKALMDTLFPWDEAKAEITPATLTMGKIGAWRILPESHSRPKMVTLRKSLWLGPAERWASVTPIVLDRYPKGDEREAEEMVAAACERIGLPRPREVVLMPGSLFIGAPPARRFPTLPKKFGKTLDQHTHALLIFDERVRGPVLLGAGRYRGYGLCRPYRLGGDE